MSSMHKIKYDEYNPKAKTAAIIQGNYYRFTILTSQLIRVEYSEEGVFDDHQTQIVLNRDFDLPDFTVFEDEDRLEIMTDHLLIKYNKQPFSASGLSFQLRDNISNYRSIWYYGDPIDDLGGTTRTLDKVDGARVLDRGLLSRFGFSVIEDTDSAIFTPEGWFSRRKIKGYQDFYFFGYGHNYLQALEDFYHLSGPQPKIPRYALGNWWSRYYPYSEESYLTLLNNFDRYETPFSVAVIDIDWHLIDIPKKYGSGWTGYTWNRELFPNPAGFLNEVKSRNYYVTLNLHPADGIRPFEDVYEVMAQALNIDSDNEQFIEFNPMDEEFMQAYFELVLYPNEDMGVDFWWTDWQQGPKSGEDSGLPSTQWLLNHIHYSDNQKNNQLGLNFSRYSGPGSHRYPVGFSGDTVISWASLNFQPYFTATASNIGYGWWSHDIGGHMHGTNDKELFLRWLQLGVLSPINRLHSSNSDFINKEPWTFDEPYQSLIIAYLQLRHKLIPYLYTMNIRAHEESEPLVQPLYYKYPSQEEAYQHPNQYFFGTELMVCPMTEPINYQSQLASFDAWLPQGEWYDLGSGLKYGDNKRLRIHRRLDSMGIFAAEGSLVVLDNNPEFTNSVANPTHLEVLVFAGQDGQFDLAEDYLALEKIEEGVVSRIEYKEADSQIIIHAAQGNLVAIPSQRSWKLRIYGRKVDEAVMTVDGVREDIDLVWNPKLNQTTIQTKSYPVDQEIKVKLRDSEELSQEALIKQHIYHYLKKAQIANDLKDQLWQIIEKSESKDQIIAEIMSLNIPQDISMPIFEFILA